MKGRSTIGGDGAGWVMVIISLRQRCYFGRIAVFRDQEYKEIHFVFPHRKGRVISVSIIGKVNIFFQETLTIAHGHGFFLINTKHFNDIPIVQVEISNDTQVVKTLE
jgi:hypothetical protein